MDLGFKLCVTIKEDLSASAAKVNSDIEQILDKGWKCKSFWGKTTYNKFEKGDTKMVVIDVESKNQEVERYKVIWFGYIANSHVSGRTCTYSVEELKDEK